MRREQLCCHRNTIAGLSDATKAASLPLSFLRRPRVLDDLAAAVDGKVEADDVGVENRLDSVGHVVIGDDVVQAALNGR